MIKRSRYVVTTMFSLKTVMFIIVGTIVGLCIMLPCLAVNYFILSFIFDSFNISKIDILWSIFAIIIGFFTIVELFIISACLSCFPAIENAANGCRSWLNE
jgi:hypothetical protein